MKNTDRLRAMTDEELAHFFGNGRGEIVPR